MSAHPDVLIIGAGVIGLTTAHNLARAGLSVTLLDSGDLGRQASWAGAGIIPPGNIATASTPIERLRAISSSLYPNLSEMLRADTGIDNGYLRCGGLELITCEDDLHSDEYRSPGIACQFLEGPAIREVEPDLSVEFQSAYWIPEVAQIRNPRHLQALIASCQKLGVRLEPHCPVRSLVPGPSRLAGVETDKGPRQAGIYLLTAGAWTQALLQPLGWDLHIRPVRGQIALLHTGHPGIRPMILAGSRYLVPRGDGRVLVGSTEEEAGFAAQTTAEGIAGLLEMALSLLPALARAQLEQSWAGLRPGSRDGLPTIGWVPGLDNVLVAAGHFRAGLQLSPGTAQLLLQLILGQPPAVSLESFQMGRPFPQADQPAFLKLS